MTDAGAPPEGRSAPRRRGRPATSRAEPLERSDVLRQALSILRADGIDGLNMRRLATELGVTPMAIYHHVPNKPALLEAIISGIWTKILLGVPTGELDPVEYVIQVNLRTRKVWLENLGIANLAMAVAEPDEHFDEITRFSAEVTSACGFPDPVLAYSTIQNFTMGAVAVAANRRFSSRYFGRNPEEILPRAQALVEERGASPVQRGIVTARFDVGDDEHFERGLRALVAGLFAGAD